MSLTTEIDDSSKPLNEKPLDKSQVIITTTTSKTPEKQKPVIKVYKKRWINVALFLLYASPSTCQWIQYSIISNIVARYYDVSLVAIDMTSITYMGYYVPLILPATYLMDRVGLRWTAILGSVLSCIGSWIKVFSASRDRFWVTFLGQSVVASTQVLVLSVPGRLAATWFGSGQLSTATSLCLFGTQMGIAAGFLASPLIVGNHENLDLVGEDLSFLFTSVAFITTFAAIMVILFFKNEPRLPPSKSRALQKSNNSEIKESFMAPIKRLLTNKSYIILCNSYGMGVGVLNAIATLLNQMILQHFEDGEKDAGRVGLALTVMGMIGAVTFGFIVDKTQRFKQTAIAVYFLTFSGQIFFAVAMISEIKWLIYASGMFLGFFLAGYLALGYELCVEYTYPEAEDVSTGLLNILNNVYGMTFVLGFGKLIETYGDVAAHIGLCSALFAGFLMTILTKDEQRRQKILRENRAASLLALSRI